MTGRSCELARAAATAVLMLLVTPARAEGPLQVVRVRVPADQVPRWFPAGSELRGMPLAEFEALVQRAERGLKQQNAGPGTRLMRARHTARWENGLLRGRSEFLVGSPGSQAGPLPLEPWTPAVIAAPEDAPPAVRAQADGRTVLWSGPEGGASATVEWELQALAGSDGRVFRLGLPRGEVSSLVLDLPAHLVPEGPSGIRQGPMPGPDTARSRWRFDGQGGAVDLRLRPADQAEKAEQTPGLWVTESTRVEVEDAATRWSAEYRLEAGSATGTGAGGPRTFEVQLDPAIELIDVVGPAVLGFSAEPGRAGARLSVRLGDLPPGGTQVSLRGLVKVPDRGRWAVPAAQPLNAIWTGGRTVVRLGGSRVLAECRDRAGRRIAPGTDEAAEAPLLVFEASAPRSVADLVFEPAAADASCKVRGQLRLGNHAPELDAQLIWHVARGQKLSLAIDLPPGWTAQRVQLAGSDEPTPWQAEARGDGGSRLRVTLPASLEQTAAFTLNVAASAPRAGLTGRLDLPRIRPTGARMADEIWVAQAEAGWTVRPVRAQGLAWVDPMLVLNESAGPFASFLGQRGGLAWRWVADAAAAEVDRQRVQARPSGEIKALATVDADRLILDWLVALELPEGASRTVILGTNEPLAAAPQWRLDAGEGGPPLPARALQASERRAAGLPAAGLAWAIDLPQTRARRIHLRARAELPWKGQGRVPLLVLPPAVPVESSVLVLVGRSSRSEATAQGLRVLDPSATWSEFTSAPAPVLDQERSINPAMYRRAHAFGSPGGAARLELRTERLEPAAASGVIPEAVLRTEDTTTGRQHQRLTLRVAPTLAAGLRMSLPRDSVLERVRRDGQPVAVSREADAIIVPIGHPPRGRLLTSVVLEYTTVADRAGQADALRPQMPVLSMPCLALSWEVALPEPWTLGDASRGLRAAGTPEPAGGLAAGEPWPWERRSRAQASSTETAMIRELDARVASLVADRRPASLGDWLIRWDAGPWPIVVDRQALAQAGWGPASAAALAVSEPGKPGAAAAALGPLGLVIVPVESVLLLTTPAESPPRLARRDRLTALAGRLRTAAGTGADPADRYQSVARWRGEATPAATAADSAGSGSVPGGGWSTRWLSASGPSAGSESVTLWNPRSRAAWLAAVALAVLVAGLAGRKAPARWRAGVLGTVLGLAIVTAAWTLPRPRVAAAGGTLGAVAVLACWWARSARSRGGPRAGRVERAGGAAPSRRTGSASASGSGSGVAVGGALLVALVGLANGADEPARRILALIPFDGVPDPHAKDARVLLLLNDFHQLRSWAEAPAGPPPGALTAARAVHRVRAVPDKPQQIDFESELELRADGPGPFAWPVPLGEARDLTATLDGQRVPLAVEAGGAAATVSVSGEGKHVLRLVRSVFPRPGEAADRLRLPVNPVPAARVVVEADGEAPRLRLASPRGSESHQGATTEAALGPADAIELRLSPQARVAPAVAAGSVDAALLWDALPAGDRVRARLVYHRAPGVGRVRVAVEPGVVVRGASAPGLIEAGWESVSGRPVWTARLEPPLPDGGRLELDLWRPAAATAPAEDEPPERAASRTLPRLEPLDVERSTAVVALRRPDDWTGSLGDAGQVEPAAGALARDAFVRQWGPLPEDGLAWAGSARLPRSRTLEVAAGPAPLDLSARQNVAVRVEPGRLSTQVSAELTERTGRLFQAEILVPRDWRLGRLECEGLTAWTRPAPDRLRLLFGGKPATRRLVQIEGWLPIVSDPLALGSLRRQAAVPWPRWVGARAETGLLAIVAVPSPGVSRAATPFTPRLTGLDTGPGVVPVAPGEAGAPPAGPGNRLAFRVDRPDDVGLLHWTAEPPRVNVVVQSLLTVHPDSAAWLARVAYQVSGGASDALYLKLPSAWAASARLEVTGVKHQLAARTEGSTSFWTIRPEQPIWGALEVTIRGSRPLRPGESLSFPDLVPLGWGTADSYLAVANASGQGLEYEGSPGLQAIDSGRLVAEGLPAPSGAPLTAYRVTRDDWTLRIGVPGSPAADPAAPARAVALADVTCVLAADGSSAGQARFELEPRSGPFLNVVLPEGAEALRATVDEHPVRPLRGSAGLWLLPLGDAGARQATLVWKAAATARALALPTVDPGPVPTLLAVYAPEGVSISASQPGGLEPVSVATLEAERTERAAQRLVAGLDQVDRSSTRDRQQIITVLRRFEIQARAAERTAWASPGPAVLQRGRDRVAAARARVVEAIRAAGLDDWHQAALASVGAVAAPAPAPAPASPAASSQPPAPLEPPATLRLRRLGFGHFFRSEGLGSTSPASLSWQAPAEPAAWQRLEVWLITAFGVLAGVLVYRVAASPERRWRMGLAAVVLAGAIAVIGIASPLACGLSLLGALAGRFSEG